MVYLFLVLAIVFEVLATSALKLTDGFTNLIPSVLTLVGYALAFYFLALVVRVLPVGIVYAVWAGVGIVLIAAIGWLFYDQRLDAAAIAGLALIIAGVAVVNLFSRTMQH